MRPFLIFFFFIQLNLGLSAKEFVHLDTLLATFTSEYLMDQATLVEKKLHQIASNYPKRTTEQDSIFASIWHLLGGEYYYTYQYKDAIRATEYSLNLKQKIYPHNHFETSRSIYNLGIYYRLSGNLNKSFELLQECLNIRKKHHRTRTKHIGKTYTELALIHEAKGDFKLALENYDNAISIFKKNQHQAQLFKAKQDKGIVLFKFGSISKAIEIFQEILQELDEDQEDMKMSIYSNIGDAWEEIGALNKAQKAYEKAVGFYKIFEETDSHNYAYTLQNLAITKRKMGQYATAEKLLNKALSIIKNYYDKEKYHFEYSAFYENYGDLLYDQKQYRNAITQHQLALINSTHYFRDTSIFANPELNKEIIINAKTDVLTYLTSKAKVFRTWHQHSKNKIYLLQAINILQLADKLVDKIRFDHIEKASKLFWREKTRPLYELATEIAYQLEDPTQFFYFMEKGKAVLLLDDLREDEATIVGNIPSDVINKTKNFQTTIASIESGILDEESREKRLRILDEYQTHITKIEQKYPKYYDHKYNVEISKIDEIQPQLLRDSAALIQYFYTQNSIYVAILDGKKIHIEEIKKDTLLNQKIERVIYQSSNKLAIQSNQALEIFNHLSNEIYQQILAPFLPTQKRLIIIPDGILSYLPFEVLTGENKNQYLLYSKLINYAYSATVYYKNINILPQNKATLLAIAPIHFMDLSNLQYSKNEVEHIGDYIRNTTLLEEKASKDNFIAQAKKHSIIHLSTHAKYDDTAHWIAFRDKKMSLAEIHALNIKGDMISLSACETAQGNLNKGEGVLSIARGFSSAGIPSTVSSMWSVNEGATAEIMIDFYKNLADAMPKDIALNKAKLKYIEQNPSPYYWAAFIHVGNYYPLTIGNKQNYVIYLLPVILILIILFYFLNKRK